MQIQFDFAHRRISIDGDGPELLQILTAARELAPNLPSITIVTQAVPEKKGQEPPSSPPAGKNGSSTTQTMRQFVRSLPLSTAMERLTAIAYYQKHHENKLTFSPKEMSDWFTHCGLQKPSQMPVTLSDTRRSYGYVENIGHAQWRITTQGENLVVGKQEAGPEEGDS